MRSLLAILIFLLDISSKTDDIAPVMKYNIMCYVLNKPNVICINEIGKAVEFCTSEKYSWHQCMNYYLENIEIKEQRNICIMEINRKKIKNMFDTLWKLTDYKNSIKEETNIKRFFNYIILFFNVILISMYVKLI
jgi:hypothetical protein